MELNIMKRLRSESLVGVHVELENREDRERDLAHVTRAD